MATVTLDDVRKIYPDGHVAVVGASFEIADGELLVLVGPSGCGKSTLLRMIAGLEDISEGELRIDGRRVNDLPPKDRDIAMVFQSYALYPHMTVAENLGFGLGLRGMDKAGVRAKVLESAAALGLESLLGKRPAALSGGQRQRVALGRALVRNPKVFLLDEPLSNLDAKLRGAMRLEIARLHRRLGATMVYVTHDQIEAMTLGQRIVVLRDGKVQQIDTPMALYARPANLFVAGFLGNPAMNLVPGRLSRSAGLALELATGERLPLDPAVAVPEAWLGRELVLGVRPESLRAAAPGGPRLCPVVEAVEPVGNECFVHLRLGDQALVLRGPPDFLPRPGDAWPLAPVGPGLHFFAAASGDRLEPAGVA
jgi:multiple sugar transport system ATP-binding protein